MFYQLTLPIEGELIPSFLTASLPIITVLFVMAGLRKPAWMAGLAGLIVGFLVATIGWKFPLPLAVSSVALGATMGGWPIMWVVIAAVLLFNITIRSGRFSGFQAWLLDNLPDDRRVLLLVIGFLFGSMLEAVAGTGTPIAITAALLIALGFPAIEALTFTLIFDTAPVAFGALGLPINVLGAVTGLPPETLGQMAGRQLPLFALILPFYVLALYSGRKGLKDLWPLALVSGGSFAATQFVFANFVSFKLCDLMASLTAIAVTMQFLRIWKPASNPAFSVVADRQPIASNTVSGRQSWYPWLVLVVVVVAWTCLDLARLGQISVQWPVLHNAVWITVYDKPYTAIWSFQPLTTGTAVLVSACLAAPVVGLSARDFAGAMSDTIRQTAIPVATVMMIVGLAYLMNYSGLVYTLGLGVVSMGPWFPFASAFLGWIAVFLTGSDTAGNALFGNLQVVAAHQLQFNPILIAATNSTGGVFAKMVSPQSIASGVATTNMAGKEGAIVSRTLPHSIFLTVLLGILVWLQQHYLHWMIPSP
ncbi:L-lactate permease [Paraburkholderia unamae]|uniref:L-lactate permease n=1 Tax=Paraburkholderia unamae TaxID=219649 RepID=UPI001CB141EB|nr:L-lactate permease [Paraburkholderia unamae]CAG9246101.1 L-lactate permease [Paraburkholderia unamae]